MASKTSRYRTIQCTIWNDDKFPFVSDDCQLIWFHVLTTPFSNPLGIFKASIEMLAAEKRWSAERYLKGFREGLREGFFEYDEKHQVIFIPNFIKYNQPANPNVLKSWSWLYNELPNCPLKDKFYQTLKDFLEGFGEGFRKAFHENYERVPERFSVPVPKDLRSEDLRSEDLRSKALKPDSSKKPGTGNGKDKGPPYEEIVEDFNQVFETDYKPTTEAVRKLINARYQEGFGLDEFKRVHRNMKSAWAGDPKMSSYLRPHTLYTGKFESYLNLRAGPSMLSQSGAKTVEALDEWDRDMEERDAQ